MAIKFHIKEFEFQNNKIERIKIIISLNLFNKFDILKIKLNSEKIKKIFNKSNKKIKIEIEGVKYVIQKTYIENISITAKMGTKNPTTTAILVGISSSVLAIILARKVKYSKYSIEPIYQDKNYIYLSINCIFKIKLVHIINIIKKLRKEYQKYGGTPNRRTYGDCNG